MHIILWMKRKRYKGTITVFLSLTLMVILSLLLAVIASARDKSMRMRCEAAMDMGLQSVFAEYNRALLEEFDLYFIDSSYGNSEGSSYYTAQHLKDYVNYNLNPSKGEVLNLSRDMYGMSVTDTNVLMESLATDSGGRVYKRQAVRYMKDKYGISIVEGCRQISDDYKEYEVDEYDPEEERDKYEKKLKKADDAKDEEGNKIDYKNPADKIDKNRSGMLEVLLGECDVSDADIYGENLAGKRMIKSGNGIVAENGDVDSAVSDLLFISYLTDKFSSYISDKGRKGLSYEVEYIINGKESDKENLEMTVAKLLSIREAANCIYAFTDESIMEQSCAAGLVVSTLLLMPELEEAFGAVIALSWAFAESCVDVQTLLKGGKVPMIKTPDSWVLKTLAEAFTYKTHLNKGAAVSEGADYCTYLQMLLNMTAESSRIIRSIEMIENDLHYMAGNQEFKMDNCIEFLEIEAVVESIFGNKYQIDRYFGYGNMPLMRFN